MASYGGMDIMDNVYTVGPKHAYTCMVQDYRRVVHSSRWMHSSRTRGPEQEHEQSTAPYSLRTGVDIDMYGLA